MLNGDFGKRPMKHDDILGLKAYGLACEMRVFLLCDLKSAIKQNIHDKGSVEEVLSVPSISFKVAINRKLSG